MRKNQAIMAFEEHLAPHLPDLSPATLRTAWNDYTDGLAKGGVPEAYNWTYPRRFRVLGRWHRTE